MDFSDITSELRAIAGRHDKKNPDPESSTVCYCEDFSKVLGRAEKSISSYEDNIVLLWLSLTNLTSKFNDLTDCSARERLCHLIFLQCAKVVLNVKWPELPEDHRIKQNFTVTTSAAHDQLKEAGFTKFGILPSLMETHWSHPILSEIMSGESCDTEEALEYINSEDPIILRLRVDIMIEENCEEFALNLCDGCLKHSALKDDLEMKHTQLKLLHKLKKFRKLQDVCEQLPCSTGIQIIQSLEQLEDNKDLCVRLAQIFLIQDWLRRDHYSCTNDLLKLWIRHQYLVDQDREKFKASIWAVAKVSIETEQIGSLIDALKRECGDTYIQLYTDLLIYAINLDKGCMEHQMLQGNLEGVRTHQRAIAKTCKRLSAMYEDVDPKISCISALTAFSLNPSSEILEIVKNQYEHQDEKKKNVLKEPLKCCSECKITGYRSSRCKSMMESDDTNVNIATIYEVERLLNMMRPYYLNPELPWEQLQHVCRKFLGEKQQSPEPSQTVSHAENEKTEGLLLNLSKHPNDITKEMKIPSVGNLKKVPFVWQQSVVKSSPIHQPQNIKAMKQTTSPKQTLTSTSNKSEQTKTLNHGYNSVNSQSSTSASCVKSFNYRIPVPEFGKLQLTRPSAVPSVSKPTTSRSGQSGMTPNDNHASSSLSQSPGKAHAAKPSKALTQIGGFSLNELATIPRHQVTQYLKASDLSSAALDMLKAASVTQCTVDKKMVYALQNKKVNNKEAAGILSHMTPGVAGASSAKCSQQEVVKPKKPRQKHTTVVRILSANKSDDKHDQGLSNATQMEKVASSQSGQSSHNCAMKMLKPNHAHSQPVTCRSPMSMNVKTKPVTQVSSVNQPPATTTTTVSTAMSKVSTTVPSYSTTTKTVTVNKIPLTKVKTIQKREFYDNVFSYIHKKSGTSAPTTPSSTKPSVSSYVVDQQHLYGKHNNHQGKPVSQAKKHVFITKSTVNKPNSQAHAKTTTSHPTTLISNPAQANVPSMQDQQALNQMVMPKFSMAGPSVNTSQTSTIVLPNFQSLTSSQIAAIASLQSNLTVPLIAEPQSHNTVQLSPVPAIQSTVSNVQVASQIPTSMMASLQLLGTQSTETIQLGQSSAAIPTFSDISAGQAVMNSAMQQSLMVVTNGSIQVPTSAPNVLQAESSLMPSNIDITGLPTSNMTYTAMAGSNYPFVGQIQNSMGGTPVVLTPAVDSTMQSAQLLSNKEVLSQVSSYLQSTPTMSNFSVAGQMNTHTATYNPVTWPAIQTQGILSVPVQDSGGGSIMDQLITQMLAENTVAPDQLNFQQLAADQAALQMLARQTPTLQQMGMVPTQVQHMSSVQTTAPLQPAEEVQTPIQQMAVTPGHVELMSAVPPAIQQIATIPMQQMAKVQTPVTQMITVETPMHPIVVPPMQNLETENTLTNNLLEQSILDVLDRTLTNDELSEVANALQTGHDINAPLPSSSLHASMATGQTAATAGAGVPNVAAYEQIATETDQRGVGCSSLQLPQVDSLVTDSSVNSTHFLQPALSSHISQSTSKSLSNCSENTPERSRAGLSDLGNLLCMTAHHPASPKCAEINNTSGESKDTNKITTSHQAMAVPETSAQPSKVVREELSSLLKTTAEQSPQQKILHSYLSQKAECKQNPMENNQPSDKMEKHSRSINTEREELAQTSDVISKLLDKSVQQKQKQLNIDINSKVTNKVFEEDIISKAMNEEKQTKEEITNGVHETAAGTNWTKLEGDSEKRSEQSENESRTMALKGGDDKTKSKESNDETTEHSISQSSHNKIQDIPPGDVTTGDCVESVLNSSSRDSVSDIVTDTPADDTVSGDTCGSRSHDKPAQLEEAPLEKSSEAATTLNMPTENRTERCPTHCENIQVDALPCVKTSVELSENVCSTASTSGSGVESSSDRILLQSDISCSEVDTDVSQEKNGKKIELQVNSIEKVAAMVESVAGKEVSEQYEIPSFEDSKTDNSYDLSTSTAVCHSRTELQSDTKTESLEDVNLEKLKTELPVDMNTQKSQTKQSEDVNVEKLVSTCDTVTSVKLVDAKHSVHPSSSEGEKHQDTSIGNQPDDPSNLHDSPTVSSHQNLSQASSNEDVPEDKEIKMSMSQQGSSGNKFMRKYMLGPSSYHFSRTMKHLVNTGGHGVRSRSSSLDRDSATARVIENTLKALKQSGRTSPFAAHKPHTYKTSVSPRSLSPRTVLAADKSVLSRPQSPRTVLSTDKKLLSRPLSPRAVPVGDKGILPRSLSPRTVPSGDKVSGMPVPKSPKSKSGGNHKKEDERGFTTTLQNESGANQCLICNKVFTSVSHLRDHVRYICRQKQDSRLQGLSKDVEFSPLYNCPSCSFSSSLKSETEKHYKFICRVNAGPESSGILLTFRCELCNEIFADKELVLDHMSNCLKRSLDRKCDTPSSKLVTIKCSSNDEKQDTISAFHALSRNHKENSEDCSMKNRNGSEPSVPEEADANFPNKDKLASDGENQNENDRRTDNLKINPGKVDGTILKKKENGDNRVIEDGRKYEEKENLENKGDNLENRDTNSIKKDRISVESKGEAAEDGKDCNKKSCEKKEEIDVKEIPAGDSRVDAITKGEQIDGDEKKIKCRRKSYEKKIKNKHQDKSKKKKNKSDSFEADKCAMMETVCTKLEEENQSNKIKTIIKNKNKNKKLTKSCEKSDQVVHNNSTSGTVDESEVLVSTEKRKHKGQSKQDGHKTQYEIESDEVKTDSKIKAVHNPNEIKEPVKSKKSSSNSLNTVRSKPQLRDKKLLKRSRIWNEEYYELDPKTSKSSNSTSKPDKNKYRSAMKINPEFCAVDVSSNDDGSVTCDECVLNFRESFSFVKHLATKHFKVFVRFPLELGLHKKDFFCLLCHEKFNKGVLYYEHVRNHSEKILAELQNHNQEAMTTEEETEDLDQERSALSVEDSGASEISELPNKNLSVSTRSKAKKSIGSQNKDFIAVSALDDREPVSVSKSCTSSERTDVDEETIVEHKVNQKRTWSRTAQPEASGSDTGVTPERRSRRHRQHENTPESDDCSEYKSSSKKPKTEKLKSDNVKKYVTRSRSSSGLSEMNRNNEQDKETNTSSVDSVLSSNSASMSGIGKNVEIDNKLNKKSKNLDRKQSGKSKRNSSPKPKDKHAKSPTANNSNKLHKRTLCVVKRSIHQLKSSQNKNQKSGLKKDRVMKIARLQKINTPSSKGTQNTKKLNKNKKLKSLERRVIETKESVATIGKHEKKEKKRSAKKNTKTNKPSSKRKRKENSNSQKGCEKKIAFENVESSDADKHSDVATVDGTEVKSIDVFEESLDTSQSTETLVTDVSESRTGSNESVSKKCNEGKTIVDSPDIVVTDSSDIVITESAEQDFQQQEEKTKNKVAFDSKTDSPTEPVDKHNTRIFNNLMMDDNQLSPSLTDRSRVQFSEKVIRNSQKNSFLESFVSYVASNCSQDSDSPASSKPATPVPETPIKTENKCDDKLEVENKALKLLRKQHKDEPFSWEDDEQDVEESKLQTASRQHKTLPFTWESSPENERPRHQSKVEDSITLPQYCSPAVREQSTQFKTADIPPTASGSKDFVAVSDTKCVLQATLFRKAESNNDWMKAFLSHADKTKKKRVFDEMSNSTESSSSHQDSSKNRMKKIHIVHIDSRGSLKNSKALPSKPSKPSKAQNNEWLGAYLKAQEKSSSKSRVPLYLENNHVVSSEDKNCQPSPGGPQASNKWMKAFLESPVISGKKINMDSSDRNRTLLRETQANGMKNKHPVPEIHSEDEIHKLPRTRTEKLKNNSRKSDPGQGRTWKIVQHSNLSKVVSGDVSCRAQMQDRHIGECEEASKTISLRSQNVIHREDREQSMDRISESSENQNRRTSSRLHSPSQSETSDWEHFGEAFSDTDVSRKISLRHSHSVRHSNRGNSCDRQSSNRSSVVSSPSLDNKNVSGFPQSQISQSSSSNTRSASGKGKKTGVQTKTNVTKDSVKFNSEQLSNENSDSRDTCRETKQGKYERSHDDVRSSDSEQRCRNSRRNPDHVTWTKTAFRSQSLPRNSSVQIRHIYHDGKIWEIQKGSVKSTPVAPSVSMSKEHRSSDLSSKTVSQCQV